jgi:hypothetical protein
MEGVVVAPVVLCRVGWWYGPNDYGGIVRVRYEIAQASFVWAHWLKIASSGCR